MSDNFILIFDLGNTLVPFNKKEMLKIQGDLADFVCRKLVIDPVAFRREWSTQRDKDLEYSRMTGKEHDFASRFFRVTQSLGGQADNHLMEVARDVMISSFIKHTEVDSQVIKALHKLAPDYSLGVLSNYLLTEPIHESLKRGGVYDCFEKVLVSKEIGFVKPDKRAFSAIVDAMQADPEKTVFVGDNLHADIIGATAFGMKAVWTWTFAEEIVGKSYALSKNICVTKTREEYYKFLDDPKEYLKDKF